MPTRSMAIILGVELHEHRNESEYAPGEYTTDHDIGRLFIGQKALPRSLVAALAPYICAHAWNELVDLEEAERAWGDAADLETVMERDRASAEALAESEQNDRREEW